MALLIFDDVFNEFLELSLVLTGEVHPCALLKTEIREVVREVVLL